MNYLAHVRLAGDEPESVVGNFIGEMVKGRPGDEYPPGVRRGIMMHRRIDAWTDSHERTKRSARLVSPLRRRWGRVMVDIFYDHLLAKNWDDYSDESFGDFLDRVYGAILGARDMLPEPVATAAGAMVASGWIERYGTREGLAAVFEGVSKRIGRENPLAGAEEELFGNYEEMRRHFEAFFPEAVEYAGSLEERG